jgi:hypothetical protein
MEYVGCLIWMSELRPDIPFAVMYTYFALVDSQPEGQLADLAMAVSTCAAH